MSKTFRQRRDDEEGIREKRQRMREFEERTQRRRHMRPEDYLDMLKDEDADIQLSG